MPIHGRVRGLRRWEGDASTLVDLRRVRDLAGVARRRVGERADVAEALPRAPKLARRLLAPWLRSERNVLVLACLCESATALHADAPAELGALRALVAGHRSAVVRAFAVNAVVSLRPPGLVAWLRRGLRRERSAYARCAYLEALAARGDAEAHAELARHAASRRLAVAARASHALSRVCGPA